MGFYPVPMAGPQEGAVVCMRLTRVPTRHIASAVARMVRDRRHLSATPGLRFWKLLGTGDGRTFTARDADVRSWAMFTVWDDIDALDTFERDSPVVRAWGRISEAQLSVHLRPLRWRGHWSGRDPLDNCVPDFPGVVVGGRVAALTRARIRVRQLRDFRSSVAPVADALTRTAGLLYRVGIGEAPIGLQGTFSVWDSASSLDAFSYASAAHRTVIRRTAETGWYAEEFFARFAVLETRGDLAAFDRGGLT